MSNQADHTIVRLRVPPELKEKIEKSAEENNRSQSAEMVARLEESFQSFTSNKIDFAYGYLSAFLRAQAAVYHTNIIDLGKTFQKEPLPDLLQEQTRYKILFNEINRLIKNLELEQTLLPFDSNEILEISNNPKNLEK